MRRYTLAQMGVRDHTALFQTGASPASDVLEGSWRMEVIDHSNHGVPVATLSFAAKSDGRLESRCESVADRTVLAPPFVLQGTLVFGDITTGRIWYAQMKEVLAADDGNPLHLGAAARTRHTASNAVGRDFPKARRPSGGLPGRGAVAGPGRVDMRLAEDNAGELYVLTKGDGMIRKFLSVK